MTSDTTTSPEPNAAAAPRDKRPLVAIVVVLLVIALVAWGFWRAAQPAPAYFQGQMEAREADIAPKVTARIAKVLVKEGQQIKPGELLVEMDSPEVRAKLTQAEAARDAAQAVADKAQAGARPQEVQMARLNWQRAQAAAELADTSYRRVQSLFDQGLVAAQKRDEALTNFRASRDQALAAKAQYDMAASGARQEDKAAAHAQARQVQGVVAEVEAARAETQLRSPVGGEISQVLAKEGELSPQGVAVVTVVDLSDQWVVLNVREDQLARFAQGSRFTARLPALDNREAQFEVYYLGVLPNFATWRATRAGQGFDARTFEVRARPAEPIAGARPGMSVVVEAAR
ncbi:HlyD family secretion protein [Diaphorobacter caeni]|uniref:HlyD family secretion protein n=1 Tax=Diaphorobacter caeni TaxID=2784387 RepID=UPI00188EDB45|nr:efflux RND transporter periplasmic adaptor subunit [Diaphorobacter caeni]MBF5007723.1 efflux RND transporter periplasmic adaptor subunit [Diaphorobacter caeni]